MKAKDRYIAEAAEYGRCSERGDSEGGNAAYDRMKAALAELRTHHDRGRSALVELLDQPDGWVKLLAATHLLPLQPDLASTVLEKLASGPKGDLRFDAEMVLQEWRAGRLKVP